MRHKDKSIDLAAAAVVQLPQLVVENAFHGASSKLLRSLADRIDAEEVHVEEITFKMTEERLVFGGVIDMKGDRPQ